MVRSIATGGGWILRQGVGVEGCAPRGTGGLINRISTSRGSSWLLFLRAWGDEVTQVCRSLVGDSS